MYGYYLQNLFLIHLVSFGVHSNDRPTDRSTDEHTRCMTHQKKNGTNKRVKKRKKKRVNVRKKKRSNKNKAGYTAIQSRTVGQEQ